MEKKIDLIINEFYELELMTNPESGNYTVKTFQPDFETIEGFEEVLRYALPVLPEAEFRLNRTTDSRILDKHLHYKETPLPTYRLQLIVDRDAIFATEFVVFVGKKSINVHTRSHSYYDGSPILMTAMKQQPINTFKFFNELYKALAKDFIQENKFMSLVKQALGEVNSVSKSENFSPNSYRVYCPDGSYTIELNRDNTLKLIGQSMPTEYDYYTEDVANKEKQIEVLTAEITKLKELDEKIRRNNDTITRTCQTT